MDIFIIHATIPTVHKVKVMLSRTITSLHVKKLPSCNAAQNFNLHKCWLPIYGTITAKDFHDPSGFDCLFTLIILTRSWSVWYFFSFLCFHAEDSPYNVQLTEQGKITECLQWTIFPFKSLADQSGC